MILAAFFVGLKEQESSLPWLDYGILFIGNPKIVTHQFLFPVYLCLSPTSYKKKKSTKLTLTELDTMLLNVQQMFGCHFINDNRNASAAKT